MGFDHGAPAGLGTDTLPAASAQYLPLTGTQQDARGARRATRPAPQALAARSSATCWKRSPARSRSPSSVPSAPRAEAARVAVETESLRNTLLASISHDLRAPLAAIMAASRALSDTPATGRATAAHASPGHRDNGAADLRAHLQCARSDELSSSARCVSTATGSPWTLSSKLRSRGSRDAPRDTRSGGPAGRSAARQRGWAVA